MSFATSIRTVSYHRERGIALTMTASMNAALGHTASLESVNVDTIQYFCAESADVSCEFVLGCVQNDTGTSLRPSGFDDSQKETDLDDLKTALSKQFGFI